MNESYRLIQEDKKTGYSFLLSMIPLARTALSKDGGSWLADRTKAVVKSLDMLTPWETAQAGVANPRLKELRNSVKSGSVVVMSDANDMLDNPLFKDATIVKG